MTAILNQNTSTTLFKNAREAVSFKERLFGLMFTKSISDSEALIFKKAGSIHTCFMRFPIDLIFLDSQKKVISIRQNIKPWRVIFCTGSTYTIGCNSGVTEAKKIVVGDILKFQI